MPTTRLQAGETPRYGLSYNDFILRRFLEGQWQLLQSLKCGLTCSLLHRKTQRPGFVETPHRRTRQRQSTTPDPKEDTVDEAPPDDQTVEVQVPVTHQDTNGVANGVANGTANGSMGGKATKDPRVDYSGHFEFGGSWGVSAIMIGFPCLMYYMWIGATYFDGHLPLPQEGQTVMEFLKQMGNLAYEGAFPSAKAWAIYWTFFIFECACYLFLPGVWSRGRPLPHEGSKQLPYYCSGVWSFYTTITVALALHFSGLFKLYTLLDEFGPLMSVAIITGFAASFVAYFSALYRGAEHRMSGYPVYDFFMGAELNPRMFGILDFKMFFEVRIPWYILFLVTLGTAARQYEQFGWISGEVSFLLMAHFLYANACSKGEELITPTWYLTPSLNLTTQISLTMCRKGTCITKNSASC